MSKLAANFTLVVAAAQAFLVLLEEFGVYDFTEGQTKAILGCLAAAGAFVGLYFHPAVPLGRTE